MLLNETKSIIVEFHKDPRVEIKTVYNSTNNISIKVGASTNFVGLIIDSKLKWHEHIKVLIKKLNSGYFAIKSIKSVANIATAKLVYYSNFEAHIRYGIEFWGCSPSTKKVFIIQKKVIRSMLNKSRRSHCKPLFIKLNILTLYSLFILQAIIKVKKTIKTLPTNNNIHTHDTRLKTTYM
jgi:hypothetical protein